MQNTDVIILGAGAAGLMCAIEAAKRSRKVLIIDHANKPGKKILMSGGGRCNFTNLNIQPENYLSHNPHFFKSALSRYTQWDFIALVKKYAISYHEKKYGQLFCDHQSKDILNMLLKECENEGVTIHLNERIEKIEKVYDEHFNVKTNQNNYHCGSLVVATGGLSIPTMGATPLGYQIASQFGLNVWPVRASLVPLTLHTSDKERLSSLSGVAVDAIVSCKKTTFRENILFTHRGMSGPAILQISNYWHPGDDLKINLLPDTDLIHEFSFAKRQSPKKSLKEFLGQYLPKRIVTTFITEDLQIKTLQSLTPSELNQVIEKVQKWELHPNGTEGYRTAEVTLGGVDCNAISSKTMETNDVNGLFFIGEVLDVTGWLGGYNFQWAWSSGWAAGQVV